MCIESYNKNTYTVLVEVEVMLQLVASDFDESMILRRKYLYELKLLQCTNVNSAEMSPVVKWFMLTNLRCTNIQRNNNFTVLVQQKCRSFEWIINVSLFDSLMMRLDDVSRLSQFRSIQCGHPAVEFRTKCQTHRLN